MTTIVTSLQDGLVEFLAEACAQIAQRGPALRLWRRYEPDTTGFLLGWTQSVDADGTCRQLDWGSLSTPSRVLPLLRQTVGVCGRLGDDFSLEDVRRRVLEPTVAHYLRQSTGLGWIAPVAYSSAAAMVDYLQSSNYHFRTVSPLLNVNLVEDAFGW